MTSLQMIRIVAADQQGVVTAEQCRDAGIGRFTVQRLRRSRQWLRLSRGAYLVDAEDIREPPRTAVIRAAVLSAGPVAVAVLDTAAEVHGIAGIVRPSAAVARPGGPAVFERVSPAAAVHVSLPGSAARARRVGEAGVRLHQFVLRPDESRISRGPRAASWARPADMGRVTTPAPFFATGRARTPSSRPVSCPSGSHGQTLSNRTRCRA